VLTFGAGCLVVGLHALQGAAPSRRLPGTGWLQALGRLSYEVYLTHMFVVLAIVRIAQATGAPKWMGFVWYVPAVLVSWLLGSLVARAYSEPCDQALRDRLWV
jgi:peptidoglycan/LPS O-acetylase OafA/YrhL